MTNIEDMSTHEIEEFLVELQNRTVLTTTYKELTNETANFTAKVKIMQSNQNDILIRIPDGVNNPDVNQWLKDTFGIDEV